MTMANTIKQPWQMTKIEWDAEFAKTRINYSGSGGYQSSYHASFARAKSESGMKKAFNAIRDRQEFLKMSLDDIVLYPGEDCELRVPARHYHVIAHALKLGLPVPDHVLKDYPDLSL